MKSIESVPAINSVQGAPLRVDPLSNATKDANMAHRDTAKFDKKSFVVQEARRLLSHKHDSAAFTVIALSIRDGIAKDDDFESFILDEIRGRLSRGDIDGARSVAYKASKEEAEEEIKSAEEREYQVLTEVSELLKLESNLEQDDLDYLNLVVSGAIAAKIIKREKVLDHIAIWITYAGSIVGALDVARRAVEAGIVTKQDFYDDTEGLKQAMKMWLGQLFRGYRLEHHRQRDNFDLASELIEVGGLTEEDVRSTAVGAVLSKSLMNYGEITGIFELIESGFVTKEDLQTEEINWMAVRAIQVGLSRWDYDILLKITALIEAKFITKEDLAPVAKASLQEQIAANNFDKVILFTSHARELSLAPSEFRSYATTKLRESLEVRSLSTLSTLVSNAPALGLQESDFLQNREQPILAKASYLALRDFGAHVTSEGIELYESMLRSKQGDAIPEEARSLGVEHPGSEGLESLRARFREEVFAFIRKEEIHEDIADMPVFSSFLKKQIRFEGSQFGQHGDDEFLKTLDIVRQNQEAGLTRTHFAYQNAFLDIPTASTETAKVVQEPEAIDGVKTVATAIEGAQFLAAQLRDSATRSVALERMQSTLDASLGNAVINLSSFVNKERERISSSTEMDDRQKQGRLKGLEAKQRLVDTLRSFQSESINGSIEKIFGDQTNQEASVEALRALLKPETLAKGEEALDPYRGAVRMLLSTVSVLRLPDTEIPKADREGDITRQQANTLLNLTDHILIQETLALGKGQEKPLSKEEKELRHAGERILRTPQIKKASEAFERAILAGAETQSIEIIPSRGTLLEFSGHISDACWASKYNIAKDFPNITSLTFVLKEKDEQGNPIPPDPIKDKLVGSCLLIETDDAQGNPTLIMRGMNPLENTINRLMPKAFVDQLMGYVEGVAKKMGRRVAIVVDEASHASTNRPSIAGVLKPMRDSGKLKPLAISDIRPGQERPYTGYLDSTRSLEMSTRGHYPTNFNGYDISQNTYQWMKG